MLTLQQIRDRSPCKGGWTKLLKSLGSPPMDTVISLGDVAKSNGAADAWWCVRALDWSDMALRRQVIAALMPTVERAAKHTTDKQVHDCLAVIHDWIDGKPADLEAAAWAAADAGWAARAAKRAADATWAAEAELWASRAAWAAELELQRADLIAAFPPLVLKD